MNLQKDQLLKISLLLFAKIRLPFPKRFGLTVSLTGTTKALFIMQKTFASIGITVKKRMPVEKSLPAGSSVLPVLPVTKPAGILKRNDVTGWTRHLMCAMAVRKKSITAPSLINTDTMPDLLTGNIGNC